MTYRHPLAWLLGLEGVALLRAHAGDGFDRAFVEARIVETRALLEHAAELGGGAEVGELSTVDGYRAWAATYDQPGNPLIDLEQPLVRQILDRIPAARFLAGDLRQLPIRAEAVDLVICALALTHVPALDPVMAEFARVLRPGGHLVVSDIHVMSLSLGGVPVETGPDGEVGLLPASRHLPSAYLTAALARGLQPRGCAEPVWPANDLGGGPLARQWCGAAADAAYIGTPAAIIWHSQRTSHCVTA